MKKTTTFILLLIISIAIVVIYTSYKTNFPDEEVNINKNLENIKSIELGMSEAEVDSIMGHPNQILQINTPLAKTKYKYKIPEGIDGFCEIAFDSTMHVVDVFYQIIEPDSTEIFE